MNYCKTSFPVLFVIGVAACSSGSSSGSGGDGSDILTNSPATHQFFHDDDTLKAIDPAMPGSEISVDTNIQSNLEDPDKAPPVPLLGGDWDSVTETVEQPRVVRVIYADDNGELYHVPTGLGAAVSISAQRISSQSGELVCDWNLAPDFNDSANAAVVFKVEDGAGECEPDDPTKGNWMAAQLNYDETQAPVDFPGKPVRPIWAEDGSFDGYLAHGEVNSDPLRVEKNFQDTTILDTANALTMQELSGKPRRASAVVFENELCVYEADGDDPDDRFTCGLYTFTDQQGGTQLFPFTLPSERAYSDEVLYFIDDEKLHRVDLAEADSAADVEEIFSATDLADLPELAGVYRVTVTPDHVVWVYPRNSTSATRVVSLERGTGDYNTTLDEDFGSTQTAVSPILRRTGGWIFFTHSTATGPQAVALAADGSGEVRHDNAFWIGGSYNPFADDAEDSFEIAHMIQGAVSPAAVGGATLRASSGTDPTGAPVNLGQIDGNLDQLQMFPFGFGVDRLAWGIEQSGSDPTNHVYYFDSSDPGSLQKIDDNTDHLPILSF